MITTLRTLLIEQSPAVIQRVQEHLQLQGYTFSVQVVNSLQEVKTHLDGPVDLILSEYAPQEFHSLDLLCMLKERLCRPPVIILDGNTKAELVAECMHAGAADFVNKSDLSRLIPTVQRALGGQITIGKTINTIENVLKDPATYQAIIKNLCGFLTLYEWYPSSEGATDYFEFQADSLLGYSASDWAGQKDFWLEKIHPEDREKILRARQVSTLEGKPYSIDYRVESCDGDFVWVRDVAVRTGPQEGGRNLWQGIWLDATDHKRAEGAVHYGEQRWNLFFEKAKDITFTLDECGLFRTVNKATTEKFGYSADELIGKNPVDFVAIEDRDLFLELLKQVTVGWDAPEIEVWVIKKNGERLCIEVRGHPFYQDGMHAETFLIARDITERVRTSHALNQANRKAMLEYENLLQKLNGLAQGVGTADNLEQIYRELQKFTLSSSPCDGMIISQYLQEGQKRQFVYAWESGDEYDVTAFPTLPIRDCPHSRALMTGEVITYSGGENLHPNRLGKHQEFAQRSAVIIPMKVLGKVLGGFEVQSKIPGAFSKENIVALQMAANLAAIAIQEVKLLNEERNLRLAAESSEERFRDLFENVNDIVFTQDQAGMILSINAVGVALTGYTREELIGMNIFQMITPQYYEEINRLLQKYDADIESYTLEVEILSKYGKRIPLEVSARLVFCEEGDITIHVIARDITERKASEKAMRDSEAQYRTIIDTSPDAITLASLDGKILISNRQAAINSGCQDPSELIGLNIFDFIDPEWRNLALDNAQQTMVLGLVQNVEYLALRMDGTTYPVEVSSSSVRDGEGKPKAIVCISRDIRARKKAEAELRQSEQLHRTLYQTMSQGVVYQNAEGLITSVNPAAEVILGLTLDQMQGRTSMDPRWRAIKPDGSDFPGLEHPSMVALQTGRAVFDQVIGVYNSMEEGVRWIEVTAMPLYQLGADKPYQVYTTFIDITERTRRERELETLGKVSATLRTAETRKEMIPVLLEQVKDLFQATGTVVTTIDLFSGNIFVEGATGEWTHTLAAMTSDKGSVSAEILKTGKAFLCQDIRMDARFDQIHSKELGQRAVAGIPMTARDTVLGVLWIGKPGTIRDEDKQLLSAIGDMAANAIRRMDMHAKAKKQLRQLSGLHTIDRAISASLDLKITLNIFLNEVVSQLGVDAANLLLLNPKTNILSVTAGKGFRNASSLDLKVRLGDDFAGRAALEREIIYIPDIRQTDRAAQFVQKLVAFGEDFITYFAVPLIARGQVKGVMEVFHRSPLQPDQDWMNFLEALGAQAAIAIDNVELFDGLQRSNLELGLAYDATIEGWSRALDLRDKETEGHTLRVTDVAVQLSAEMGFTQDELVHIRRGALLHDIGKMGIPDQILLKPGPLTDEEWVVMKKHPEYALELLNPIHFLRPALQIPYGHHERWDGSGYPQGLKGEQIPLAARVFAVVDVWDALCSDRPYRPGWAKERVIGYIGEQSGKQFDPRVVEAFLRIIRE